jgi:hypothetical protein
MQNQLVERVIFSLKSSTNNGLQVFKRKDQHLELHGQKSDFKF